jgi:Fe-S-cluster containining protein
MSINTKEIQQKLDRIYSKIPDFECKHCHECEAAIVWFKPEEINIRDYLKKHNMKYIQWTKEQFRRNKKKCPYLKNDRCSIYEVRPIVCRLQGTVDELPCKHNKKIKLSKKQVKEIKDEMDKLVKEMDSVGQIFGTKKYQ